MNYVFLMDPLHTVKMEKDTSFILMLGAHARGHQVYFLPDGGITRDNGQLRFRVVEVTPQIDQNQPFIENKPTVLTEDNVDIVMIRSDPPFDEEYLLNTWLLDLLPDTIPVINTPSGIRTANEKIWAMQFTELIPPTLVARNRDDLLSFLAEEKDAVAKPTNGFGGQSVFRIKNGEKNTNVILETLTQDFKREIIVQKYVQESEQGDKRILLLDGEILGAVLRVHSEDDHRNNFFSGGEPQATEVTDREKEIVDVLKPHLKTLGLYFVGIDVLGDYLTEVNVTSPTCLQEMNRLYDVQLEQKVIEFSENLVKHAKSRQ